MDVFLVHRATGATKLISQSSAGVQGDSSSSGASLTEVADLVVFHSFAGNLVPTDGNGTGDVFARVP